MTVESEILRLDFDEFVQMVFQLVGFELLEVILRQNHVLNKLSDFLVELYNVWLSMNKILDWLPLLKHTFIIGFQRTSSKWVHKFAKHLWCSECLSLRLFNSKNVLVKIQSYFCKCADHISHNNVSIEWSLDRLHSSTSRRRDSGLHIAILCLTRRNWRPSWVRPLWLR